MQKKNNTKPPTNPYFSNVYGLAISVLLFMPAADHKGYGGSVGGQTLRYRCVLYLNTRTVLGKHAGLSFR